MKKIATSIGLVCLLILALSSVVFAVYGQYQGSQLYPMLHQEIGAQNLLSQLQQQAAQQQAAQQTQLPPSNE